MKGTVAHFGAQLTRQAALREVPVCKCGSDSEAEEFTKSP
jgi:hypothetical protein